MAEGGEQDHLSKSLQKLDEELTCPLCTQHFREPKVLPCLHYCCKTCIADLIKSANGRPFNCPKCHREAQAEGNDPESFPTHFYMDRMEEVFSVIKKAESKNVIECEECSHFPAINFCHDCSEYICTKCSEAHKHMRHFYSHKVVSINSLHSTISKGTPEKLQVVDREVKCSEHKDEALKLYCSDCHKLVCCNCIVVDHKDHRYALVVDAAPLCKAEVKKKAESVRKISDSLKAAVKSLEESKKKLLDQGTTTERAIDDALDKMVAKMTEKRRELKAKASEMVSEAVKKVSEQEKNAGLAVGEVESLLEFMSHSLETTTDQELLSLTKQMLDQVDRVSCLYDNPAGKFPAPELPLEVQCGPEVEHVIESGISVTKKEQPQEVLIQLSEPATPKERKRGLTKLMKKLKASPRPSSPAIKPKAPLQKPPSKAVLVSFSAPSTATVLATSSLQPPEELYEEHPEPALAPVTPPRQQTRPEPAPKLAPRKYLKPPHTSVGEPQEIDPPDNLLYTVMATHHYGGEDGKELSFEKGDTIYVIPYDDPDGEEQGWCMGVLKKNGDKGLFPETFTKRQD